MKAGLAPQLTHLSRHAPDLAPILPALVPPSLESVGDKLHEKALAEAITTAVGVRRKFWSVHQALMHLGLRELRNIVLENAVLRGSKGKVRDELTDLIPTVTTAAR